MKIDEMFRDGKSLLGMGRLINKRWVYMEKMLALLRSWGLLRLESHRALFPRGHSLYARQAAKVTIKDAALHNNCVAGLVKKVQHSHTSSYRKACHKKARS